MKPDFFSDSAIFLAAWLAENRAFILGSLRDAGGEVRTEVIERHGSPWGALRLALADALIVGPKLHLVILSNDAGFVRAVRGYAPLQPDHWSKEFVLYGTEEQRRTGKKGEYVNVGWGGDADQWECLYKLGMWPRSWRAVVAADLPGARERWVQQFSR